MMPEEELLENIRKKGTEYRSLEKENPVLRRLPLEIKRDLQSVWLGLRPAVWAYDSMEEYNEGDLNESIELLGLKKYKDWFYNPIACQQVINGNYIFEKHHLSTPEQVFLDSTKFYESVSVEGVPNFEHIVNMSELVEMDGLMLGFPPEETHLYAQYLLEGNKARMIFSELEASFNNVERFQYRVINTLAESIIFINRLESSIYGNAGSQNRNIQRSNLNPTTFESIRGLVLNKIDLYIPWFQKMVVKYITKDSEEDGAEIANKLIYWGYRKDLMPANDIERRIKEQTGAGFEWVKSRTLTSHKEGDNLVKSFINTFNESGLLQE